MGFALKWQSKVSTLWASFTAASARCSRKLCLKTNLRSRPRSGLNENSPALQRCGRPVESLGVREADGRNNCSSAANLVTGEINRVPDKRKSAPGLAAVLGPETEKDDPAFAHFDLGQSDLVLNLVLASQPARSQHTLLRITGNHLHRHL